jgi:hypothetical protein
VLRRINRGLLYPDALIPAKHQASVEWHFLLAIDKDLSAT